MDQLRLGRVVSRKGRQATFEKRRADLFQKASDLSKMCDVRVAVVVYDPHKAEPATWPPEQAEAAAILLRQKAEKLRCRELNMMKLAERAREIFLVLNDFVAGNHQVLQVLPVDLVADAMAVVELRKKVVSDHLKLQMASQAPPTVPAPAAVAAGEGMGVSGPVDMDDGEPRRGSNFLEMAAAIMAEESWGVHPTDGDLERFVRELHLCK
jgi:hypothetical protein